MRSIFCRETVRVILFFYYLCKNKKLTKNSIYLLISCFNTLKNNLIITNMPKFNSFKTFAAVMMAASLGALTSCTDYTEFSEAEIRDMEQLKKYTELFEARFGKIDPNHTWGMDEEIGCIEAFSDPTVTRAGGAGGAAGAAAGGGATGACAGAACGIGAATGAATGVATGVATGAAGAGIGAGVGAGVAGAAAIDD